MRIGLLADVYKPFVSGVTNFVSQHKRALEAMGHKVFVFTLGHTDYEDDELHVYRSPGIPLTGTGYQFGFVYSRLARRTIKTMDVLHAQQPFISGSLALTYGKRYGIPVIFTNHSRYDKVAPHYVPLLPASVPAALVEVYLSWFANQCCAVVAPTRAVRRALRECGVTAPIPVIPNGVDLSPFCTPSCPRTRAELGLPDEAKVAIYVGRIAPEKNLSFLLRAFARVRQGLPQACLLIVGSGPEERVLCRQAKELGIAHCTVFTGQVLYEQVPDYLALADVFVTPSVVEVQPLSIIEGLAAGLPALAIASDAVADTLTDGYNSLLTDRNCEDFVGRWAMLLADGDLRERLSANARESSQRYDIRRTAAQMAKLYEKVAGGRRGQERESEGPSSVLERTVEP